MLNESHPSCQFAFGVGLVGLQREANCMAPLVNQLMNVSMKLYPVMGA